MNRKEIYLKAQATKLRREIENELAPQRMAASMKHIEPLFVTTGPMQRFDPVKYQEEQDKKML